MTRHRRLLAALLLLLPLWLPARPALAGGVGYHPNGQVQWEYLYQDGEIREVKWYDELGRLTARATYRDGQQVTSEGYRSDGALEWQTRSLADNRQEVTRFGEGRQAVMRYTVVAGQADGESTLYQPNGQPRQMVTFRKGVPDGPARTYHDNGQVESEYAYRNGEVDGPYRLFSADGQLTAEYTFEAGKLR